MHALAAKHNLSVQTWHNAFAAVVAANKTLAKDAIAHVDGNEECERSGGRHGYPRAGWRLCCPELGLLLQHRLLKRRL